MTEAPAPGAPAPVAPVPSLPVDVAHARAERAGRTALWLAVWGYAVALAPIPLALSGGRGRNAFATMGVVGGVLFAVALVMGMRESHRSPTARVAMALAAVGIVFALNHAPVVATIYNAIANIIWP